ncbi:MAG: ABC transporter permease [Lachnospiraceae bacterium]|nr:ABC transporter permease [Lachnospiraceae bacterium]
MFNLLKMEFYKLKRFPFGYVVLLFFLVIGIIGGGYKLPDYFENTAAVFAETVCDTSLVIIISLAAAFFMGKDFSSRTINNEIKLGYSRFKILLSKMMAVCTFAAFIHAMWVAANVLSFAAVRGFDRSVLCIENALWLITVWIQMSAVISGVVLITFITRTVAGSIAISSMYVLLCCNILRNYTYVKVFTMSPFCFARDNNMENLFFEAIVAFVTLILFSATATVIFNRSDVK